jgi:hypothetical protein
VVLPIPCQGRFFAPLVKTRGFGMTSRIFSQEKSDCATTKSLVRSSLTDCGIAGVGLPAVRNAENREGPLSGSD